MEHMVQWLDVALKVAAGDLKDYGDENRIYNNEEQMICEDHAHLGRRLPWWAERKNA